MKLKEEVSIYPKEQWKDILFFNKEDFLNSKEVKKQIRLHLPQSENNNIGDEDIRNNIKDISYNKKFSIINKTGSKNEEWTSEIDEISHILKDKNINITLFFKKQWADINIHRGSIDIPLCLDKYWFEDKESIHIKPIVGRKSEINLHPKLKKMYDNMFDEQDIFINELLENIGKVVNDSIAYDFDYMKEKQLQENKQVSFNSEEEREKEEEKIREARDIKMRETYIPTWIETNKGVCHHAGTMIRNILSKIWLPTNIKYLEISTSSWWPASHDTTLVFDRNTGNRAIVNSKSPTKNFNLAWKEDLPKLWNIS